MAKKAKEPTSETTMAAQPKARKFNPKIANAKIIYKAACDAAKNAMKEQIAKIKAEEKHAKLLNDPAQLQLLKKMIAEKETVDAKASA